MDGETVRLVRPGETVYVLSGAMRIEFGPGGREVMWLGYAH